MVYGVDSAFTCESSIFIPYSEIQLSMIQEITSFTLKYAFRNPESPPANAASTTATIKHIYHGIPNFNAKYRDAPAPITYCPAAPMLKRPTLYANKTDKEHNKSADAFTSVVPQYFITATELG